MPTYFVSKVRQLKINGSLDVICFFLYYLSVSFVEAMESRICSKIRGKNGDNLSCTKTAMKPIALKAFIFSLDVTNTHA
uniref:Uncharacterized protein n=1 Tax=Romanomermis culicivorax TaxID=13658 RepID=A0A915JV94_ROMCU